MSNRLKELLKHVADKTIVRMVTFVASRVRAGHRNVIEVIIENALVDSAEYADSHMREAVYFRSKEDLWDFALSKIEFDGLVLRVTLFRLPGTFRRHASPGGKQNRPGPAGSVSELKPFGN